MIFRPLFFAPIALLITFALAGDVRPHIYVTALWWKGRRLLTTRIYIYNLRRTSAGRSHGEIGILFRAKVA